MTKITILVFASLLISLAAAQAKAVHYVCNKGKTIIKWPVNEVTMYINTNQVFGQINPYTLNIAVDRFNENPSKFKIKPVYTANIAIQGAGVNELLLAYGDNRPYAGLTYNRFSCKKGIYESDILINASLPWKYSEKRKDFAIYGGSNVSSTSVLIHELGHVAGLLDVHDRMSNMGMSTYVTVNGSEMREYVGEDLADDLSDIYGDSAEEVQDLAVSHWRYAGKTYNDYWDVYHAYHEFTEITADNNFIPQGSRDYVPSFELRRGKTYDVEFTYENNGQNSATVDVKFYLSPNDFISVNDREIRKYSDIVIDPNSVYTKKISVKIPSDAPLGGGYLGVIVNPDNEKINGKKELTLSNNKSFFPLFVVD